MKIRIVILLIATHFAVGVLGFGAGIYALPILIAPPTPSKEEIKAISSEAKYTAQFQRDLKDSDALHWGEGTVSVGSKSITFMGKLAPGPDYKLYLSPEYVETEAEFSVSGLTSGAKAEVLGEGRTISLQNGKLRDHFNGYDVHLYVIR